MPKCPGCTKEVYFAEKVTSIGKDWHRACLKCEKCGKTLSAGSHAENSGKPYCHKPCYAALFGPGGYINHTPQFKSAVATPEDEDSCSLKARAVLVMAVQKVTNINAEALTARHRL